MANKGTNIWVDKLSKTEMPVLSTVVRQLNQLVGDDDTEVNQLAEVILKDPHLTSQILRIANSVQYNPSNTSISTISRAIVLLGFGGVRSLCISLMVIDSLLGREPRERLLQAIAKAFHAAVVSRSIIKQISHLNHEEVFIAALLYHLGEMAFWAYGGQTADKLDDKLGRFNGDHSLIEKELGINFTKLSRELGKVWNLGNTLQEALSASQSVSKLAQAVRLGEAVSQLDLSDKKALADCLRRIAALTGDSVAETRRLVNSATSSAAVVALEFGASQVCHLMPRQKDLQRNEQQVTQVLSADPNLQLKVLRDLANSVNEKVDVNTIFQMTLEGMHRGIGLERVVLAFCKQNQLKVKYVLGQFTEGWREQFSFSLSPNSSNIFASAVAEPEPTWFDEAFIEANSHLYCGKACDLMGKRPSFIGALRINRRNAAVFYADRGLTQETLSMDQFDAFKHFLSQAELTIQAMADDK